MAAALALAVWSGRDNTEHLVLLEDGAARADLSPITKVWITIGGSVIKSEVVGVEVVWWTEQREYLGETVDTVKLRLGGQGLTPGRYVGCRLEVWDPDHPNGLVWSESLNITVKA